MGRLMMLSILLTLSLWGAPADGAPQDGATPQARPTLPPGVKPGDYVQAVVKLHQAGKAAQAGPYIKAANDFRDMLTPEERAVLDRYSAPAQAYGSNVPTSRQPAPAAYAPQANPRDRAVALTASARQALAVGQVDEARRLAMEAQSLGVPFAATEDNPARLLAEIERSSTGPLARNAASGARQQGLWMLKSAREQMALGNLEQAAQIVAQVKAMNIRWTLFDDTPAKVESDLAKLGANAPGVAAAQPVAGDRKRARAQLKEARAALESGDIDRAEMLAGEVNTWNLTFGALEDNPAKVMAAARALRRREQTRRGGGNYLDQSPELYATLVAQAREQMAAGQFAQAEASALQAQRMNVVPPLAADRAEAVLHDLANARAGYKTDASVTMAAVQSPSQIAEQQANALLAQNQLQAARAKFEEAERLRAQEAGLTPDVAPVAIVDASGHMPAQATPAPGDPFAQIVTQIQDQPNAPVGDPIGGTPRAAADAMAQAVALMQAGNFHAARLSAEQARAAGGGLEAENLLAQIEQTRQQAALSLYEAALDSIRKGEVDRSRALLMELSANDLDESMQQRVQDLLSKLPRESGPANDHLRSLQDAEALKAQQLNAEVGTKVAEARRLLETDPAKAIEILEQTRVSVQNAGMSEAVTRTMTRRLDVAIDLAKKDKVAFDTKMQDKNFRDEIERKRLRMIEADKQKKARFKEYMDKAQEAQATKNWVEAEKYAKLAAEIDPNEISATALATIARTQRHYDRDLKVRDATNDGFLTAMIDVSEAGVISPEVLARGIDPGKGFAELTQRRRALAEKLAPQKSAKVLEIESVLDKPITLPNSDQMTLGETIQYIAEYTGLNIVPDHGALAEEGLTLNTPVNVTAVKNVKLKSVLKYMLSPLHLSYTIDREAGVLMITSPQANKSRMYPVAYSVADLVMSPHDRKSGISHGLPFVAPPGMSSNDPSALQAQAAAMSGLQPDGMMPMGTGASATTGERDINFEPLIRLIKTSIAPGTWSNDHSALEAMGSAYGQGGGLGGEAAAEGVGSITPFYLNISLIIRQTSEVHEEIVELLRQLRRLQDLQVSIEVRFITVDDSFFELIGVDFDFMLQSDAVGRKSSFAVPNPAFFPFPGGTAGTGGGTATTAVQPYLINPIRDHAIGREPLVVGTNAPTNDLTAPAFAPNLGIPFQQNTIDAITPFNIVPNATANFGIAFLSDLEVYFFMTAIQGDSRSNVVQAPKVTSFNGAPASVINFRGENYVAALQPIIGAGAVAFQPQIQTFPSGVQLFVTPVVSADRRYVRLSLSPFFTTLDGFDNFTIPAAVGGGGLGGQSSTINAQVQLPRFLISNVSTTVTVPDGGTVLLGGVKELREERDELGVPILGKTPLINRLFRNVGIGRRTRSLMLMVTPRIIILEEEEERLGIPLIQNATF